MPQIRLFLAVTHAAFDESRRKRFAPLRAELETQCAGRDDVELYVHEDFEAKGSLGPWHKIASKALDAQARGFTHLLTLPDDAILVPHFVQVALEATCARPNDVLDHQSNLLSSILPAVSVRERAECVAMLVKRAEDSLRANSAFASEVVTGVGMLKRRLDAVVASLKPDPYAWYSTLEGATLFGGTIPLTLLREHMTWRLEHLEPSATVQGDEGLNMWCLATGRKIYKSLPSLVCHDRSVKSLDWPDVPETSPVKSVVFDGQIDLRGRDWTGPAADLGLTYTDNFWKLIFCRKVEKWSTPEEIERVFAIQRGNAPLSQKPQVWISSPCYGGIEDGYLDSRDHTMADLEMSGKFGPTITNRLRGESLITKARQISVHLFLASTATHLFFWDADVECLDYTALRTMVEMSLENGWGVIGGAYPFKNGSGMVVANMLSETIKTKHVEWDASRRCCSVRELGTGFMLISREAILRVCAAHPELLYKHQFSPTDGRGVWAIFDTLIENGRYLSEDFHFCKLWRDLGEKVWCYAHPRFRHWGKMPGEGHILDAWKLRATAEHDAVKARGLPVPNPNLEGKIRMPAEYGGGVILRQGHLDENMVDHPRIVNGKYIEVGQ